MQCPPQVPPRQSQSKPSQEDWARIWFSKLAQFHKVHDAKKWSFTEDDVIAFLRSKLQSGVPAWKRLKVVQALIFYRNNFMRSKYPRMEHIRAKLQQIAASEERNKDGGPSIEEVVGKINPNEADVIQAMRRSLRLQGKSYNTENAYVKWVMPKGAEYRRRLSDISWMMRLACQPIAVRANKEDGVDGRFFAKRFDCERLQNEVDVLNCSLYVDLNWIHAGMAETPEQSRFTSAFDRIQARWQQVQREMGTSAMVALPTRADDWLAPIFLDERADAYVGPETSSPDTGNAESKFCNPIRSARVSNKSFLPMSVDQYLSMLDTVGRVVREGKQGFIPADLPPILRRLGLEPQSWLDSFLSLFRGEPQPPPSSITLSPG